MPSAEELKKESESKPYPILWLSAQCDSPTDFITVLSTDADATRKELSGVEKSLNNAAVEIESLKIRLEDFSNNLEELADTRAELEQYKMRTYAPPPQRQDFARIEVDKFDGSPNKLKSFLFDMSSKMMTESHIYGVIGPFASAQQLQLQLRTYVAHTTGKARAQLENYYSTDGQISLSSVDQLITILRSAFGDVDEVGTAQRKVLTIKQGNRNLGDFLAEWQMLAAKTGFGDTALVFMLKQAIHPTLLKRLTLAPYVADTWIQFIEVLRNADMQERIIDPNYFRATGKNNNSGGFGGQQGQQPPAQDFDAMDLSKVDISSVGWSKKDEGRRPANDDEKKAKRIYCMVNDLCNWCYSKEHKGDVCPHAIWNKTKSFYLGPAKKDKGNASA